MLYFEPDILKCSNIL